MSKREQRKSRTIEVESRGRISGLREMITGKRSTQAVRISYGRMPRRERKQRESKGLVYSVGYTDKLPHPSNMGDYNQLNSDGEVESAITLLTDMMAGVGFHTKMPEDTNDDHPNKKTIDDWNKEVNLDKVLKEIARVRYEKGFCPVEIIDQTEIRFLPPETIFRHRSNRGDYYKITQEVNSLVVATWNKDEINKDILLFIHKESQSHPYGKAISDCIAERLDNRSEMNRDINEVIHKQGYPFRWWRADTTELMDQIFPAATEREVDEDIFIEGVMTNQIEVHTEQIVPRFGFTDHVLHNDEMIAEALHAPLLLYLKNANLASATAILDSIHDRIMSEQQQLKREVESWFWKPIVSDPLPRLIWGMATTGVEEISILDVSTLFRDGTITFEQGQDLLKEIGVPLADIPTQPMQPQPQPGISPDDTGLTLELDYKVGLNVIHANYTERKISLTEALKEGGRIIMVAVQKNRLQAIGRVSKALNRQITKLSMESEQHYMNLENQLFSDFKVSLLPKQKSKIQGRPTSYNVIPVYK